MSARGSLPAHLEPRKGSLAGPLPDGKARAQGRARARSLELRAEQADPARRSALHAPPGQRAARAVRLRPGADRLVRRTELARPRLLSLRGFRLRHAPRPAARSIAAARRAALGKARAHVLGYAIFRAAHPAGCCHRARAHLGVVVQRYRLGISSAASTGRLPMNVRNSLLGLLCALWLSPAARAWDRGEATTFARLPNDRKYHTGQPEGIAVDKHGNVYVTQFDPFGDFGGEGKLIVFDHAGNLVRVVTVAGASPALIGLDFHP